MKDFSIVAQIWYEGKILYLTTEIEGAYIPTQDDMEARDSIVKELDNHFEEYEILDLTGVIYEGETLWSD